MARIRSIKPAFWASEALATRLPGPDGRQARLLFIGLWGLAEDLTGVLRGHPSRIRSDLFAYDDDVSAADIDRWLGLLEAGRFIVRYERDGSRYVWVRGFIEHQKIDKPSKSTLPEPSDTEKKDRREPSPSPPLALPEPSAPEVGSRKGGGEEVEEDLSASQRPADAVPERPPLVLKEQTAKKPPRKHREPTQAETIYKDLQDSRQERCEEVGEPFIADSWDFARQNERLKALCGLPPDDGERLTRAWELYLADVDNRAREPPWSLAYFLSPGVRSKYETRAAREAAT